jgi:hypothetical protein
VTVQLTGLRPNTTYHHRVVATSGDGSATGVDRTFATAGAPSLTALKLSPAKFAAARSDASIAARVHVGTTVSYSESGAAATKFVVSRRLSGVRVKGRCVAPPRHRRGHGRPCRSLKRVGAFTHTDLAGRNHFKFTGRVGRHRLRPGRYRLAATPRANGLTGKTVVRSFRVVR